MNIKLFVNFYLTLLTTTFLVATAIVNGFGNYSAQTETPNPLNIENYQFDKNKAEAEAEAIRLELESVPLWNNQRFEESILNMMKALKIWRQLGDRENELRMLNLLGNDYESLGAREQALYFYQQALEIHQYVDNLEEKAFTLHALGSFYENDRNYQQALDYYQQALNIARQVDDECREATYLSSIGGVYLGIAHLNLEAILGSIGVTYDHLEQLQKASNFYQQALAQNAKTGTQDSRALTLGNLAELKRKQGNLQEALTDIKTAIDIIENHLNYLITPEFRTSYFSSRYHLYEIYINILMQLHQQNPTQGYDAKAFNASEMSRARSLQKLLAEANVDIRQGVDPQLLEQERNLQEELNNLERRRIELSRGYYSQEQHSQLEQTRQTVLSKYKNLQDQIRLDNPNYGALQYSQPFTSTQIQQKLLDKDTILLQYHLGYERNYLWEITQDNITSYQLPPRREIEIAAQSFLSFTTDKNATIDEVLQASTKLTQLILPNLNEISQKRLLIVPDDQLHYLPFSALSVNSSDYQPLLTKHQVIHLPSASTIAINRNQLQQRTTAPNTLAIIANPVFSPDDKRFSGETNPPSDQNRGTENLAQLSLERSTATAELDLKPLPYTQTEADTILQLLPSQSSLGIFDFEANLNRVKDPDLSEYQIVHFATHGIYNLEFPELSGLVLSLIDSQGNPQNGFLRLNDIFNLNIPAELVVLSACQTGSGKNVKGEGIVGLTRGFMYAGAPRIIASLWNVNDASTAELMSQFYQKYLQENLPPAEALRQAQLAMWQSENIDWRNPYYWAAFTLQGEWR